MDDNDTSSFFALDTLEKDTKLPVVLLTERNVSLFAIAKHFFVTVKWLFGDLCNSRKRGDAVNVRLRHQQVHCTLYIGGLEQAPSYFFRQPRHLSNYDCEKSLETELGGGARVTPL